VVDFETWHERSRPRDPSLQHRSRAPIHLRAMGSRASRLRRRRRRRRRKQRGCNCNSNTRSPRSAKQQRLYNDLPTPPLRRPTLHPPAPPPPVQPPQVPHPHLRRRHRQPKNLRLPPHARPLRLPPLQRTLGDLLPIQPLFPPRPPNQHLSPRWHARRRRPGLLVPPSALPPGRNRRLARTRLHSDLRRHS